MLDGVAGYAAGAGVGVLDVVDRVFVGAGGQQIQVNVNHGVHGGACQGIAGGVHPYCVNQVVEGNYRAGALGHAHCLAVLDQVD